MLFSELIAVYCEHSSKHTETQVAGKIRRLVQQ
jgi:hypothetical protein